MNNTQTYSIPQAKNAILVIDMQNDFVLPSSPTHVAGAYATIPAISRFLEYGRKNGWQIIYLKRIHRPSGVDAELFRRHFFEEGHPICVPGSEGAEIVSQIKPESTDIEINKQRFSGFFGTDLLLVLRGLGVENIYITGTQYPNCIRSTAVDAMGYDYNTTVVTDCCSAATPEIAQANILDIENMGISCVSSDEIMK